MLNALTQITAMAAKDCEKSFFGLNSWFHYLQTEAAPDCSIKNFKVLGANSDIPLVLLAIVDDLLRVAGLIAVIFVVYGAILYVTSQGSPDQTAKAQSTIVNALVGLVIAIVAVAFVSFIGSRLGG